MPDFQTIDACRACGGRYLNSILDLGTPVLSDFPWPFEADPARVPLEMVQCDDCEWVQLRHTTDATQLYVKKYWYESSVNDVMRAELDDIVRKAVLMVGGIDRQDTVLDIGANDGYLLSRYAGGSACPARIAFEPALSLNDLLRPHAEVLAPDLFPNQAWEVCGSKRVKIVTSIAVFNHVHDPIAFVAAIDGLLSDDGVWVMQVQDLAQQVACTAYDNCCHEHVLYPSLMTFEHLLEPFDLRVAAVERRAINGGSLRIYVRRRHERAFPDTVFEARGAELSLDREALARYAARVTGHRAQLTGTIDHFRQHGTEVDLYAASTKSSTLLQHCGLDQKQIRCAVERTPKKWGRVTSGTRIPIVSEDQWRLDPAPVLLIGAWQFASFFRQRESEFLRMGGRMLIPLPQTEIVEQRQEAAS